MFSGNARRGLTTAVFASLLLATGCKSGSSDDSSRSREAVPVPVDTRHGGFEPESLPFDAGHDAAPSCSSSPGLDGGSSCPGVLGQSTFTRALCSCGSITTTARLTTDGFNSTLGPPDGGLGGSVAANRNDTWSSSFTIGGDLLTPGNLTESSTGTIRGSLFLGGTAWAGAKLVVDGNASVVRSLPKNVTVLGTTTHVPSVAAPCDCTNLVPIASMVAAHRAPANDDATIGLSPGAATGDHAARIDLPCGNYYLSQIQTSTPLTIAAHGQTALYVDGDVFASAPLTFQIDPTATLDLFVAGKLVSFGSLTLGSTSRPSRCRAYVAGSDIDISGASTIGCNLYAPTAAFDTSAAPNVYGSLFVGGFTASANTTIHYDQAIQSAGGECCSTAKCDDGNPCTVDSCNGDGSCDHAPAADGTACSGTNRCEQSYACQAGACVGSNPVTCAPSDPCHVAGVCNPTSGACSNPSAPDGTTCSDGNACTQTDSCQSGACTGSNQVTCTAEDQCHVAGTCNPSTGTCSNPTAADGTTCNDGNACTQTDTCQAGACAGTNPVTCAAGDQCHAAGACNPTSGACSNPILPNGTSCSDGNACTQTDSCQNGSCTGANPVACAAADQCHAAGTCNPSSGTCSNPTKANGSTCSDGNACTQSDTCQSGTCTGANPVTCTAADQCHAAGTCDPSSGTCSNPSKANGSACSDGDACTQTDACQNGTCTGSNPVTCGASDQCHIAGTCNPNSGTCSNPVASNGTSCSDGNSCTQTDACQNGTCTGSNPVTCTASDQCHAAGTCNPSSGTCSNPTKANGSACSDGNACTQSDTCQSGTCTGANPVTCTAADQCHAAGTCDPSSGTCSNPTASNGTTCSDGNACTQTDACQNGTCTGSNPVTCTASDQCHAAGTCNPTSGTCSNPAVSNGTTCSDGDACTRSDACQAGTCTGANPVTCTASDQCHAAGACDPASGTCSNPAAADGTTCNDGNACTQSDACQAGSCAGGNPVSCAASDSCHVAGTCNPTSGQCSNPAASDGTSCSSNSLCDTSFACVSGTCTGSNPVSCPPVDQCHVAGTCDPGTGTCISVPAPDGTPCHGADQCLTNYVCQAGTCNGTSPVVCQPQDACHIAGRCDSTAGCSNPVIPGCDSAPVQGDSPFETQASIIGRVQTLAGVPVSGYTVTVYDVPVDVARTDAVTTEAADGSFWTHLTTFPSSEPPRTPPHHEMVVIQAPGYLRVMREVYAHPGTAANLGVIDVVQADSNTVTVGPSGGSVTDSKGLITLVIPPGALSAPTPITVTPIQTREEMPAVLPTATLTGYGFDIQPSGTQLAQPATLHIKNWRNAPTAQPIPAGTFDELTGGWKHVGMGTWNGTDWTYTIGHFSEHDLNPNAAGEWVLLMAEAQDPNGGAQICGGSSISVSGGSVKQDIPLPTYRHRGRDYGVGLNYDSGLAGNRTLGTGPSGSSQAVPVTGVGVSARGSLVQKMCLPQDAAAKVLASSPGSCGLGACGLSEGAVADPWAFTTNWMGLQQSQTVTMPSGADGMDIGTWVSLPLGQDGSTTVGSGFVTQQVTAGISLKGGGTACVAAGAFGSPNMGEVDPTNLQYGPALNFQRQVLVHHRHNSPFGAGWALDDVPRLFVASGGQDHATLVRPDGSEEEFRPRVRITTQAPGPGGSVSYAFAVDPVTGENLVAEDKDSSIVRLNGDGTTTPVQAGLAFDGAPQSLAVTYIGGQRSFLVALTTRLLWVQPGGSVQSIYTRGGNTLGSYLPAQVAARGNVAIYSEGRASQPVLYRIRLSSPAGAPEIISFPQPTGADLGLDPTTTTVSGYYFYGPGGVAYAPSGELYVADTPRNAVYKLGVDLNGEIGPTSSITHVVGDGSGRWIPLLGESFPAVQFPINQPFYLSTSPDGTLLMGTQYGVAAFDPMSKEADFIVYDRNTPTSDLRSSFFGFLYNAPGPYTNLAATGPRAFLLAGADTSGPAYPSLFDTSALGSDIDPTRTLTFSGVSGQLVDTSRAVVESFDSQGRLVQRNLRTGEPVLSIAYADAASDRVTILSDPDGNATTFTYDPGTKKLSSILNPQGRVTSLGRNGFGDLTSITQPDGETITFAYDGHHMTSKTARGTDTTTYTYRADGTLQSATKPAGETTTITASLSTASPTFTGAPTEQGTYTDAHGVTHAFATDLQGQIQTDSYTADGVAYTRALVYTTQLDALPTEFAARKNANLLRSAVTTLNGVPLTRIAHFDSLGRVDVEDGQFQRDRVYQYDSNGWLSDVYVGPSNLDQRIVRDAAGHPLRIFDESYLGPAGRELDFTWGRNDGQPSTIVKHGVTYTLSYDDGATRNVSNVVDTLGRTASFGYDGSGNVAVASDGATTSSFGYDGNNRLLVAADAQSNQTLLRYTQVSCGCSENDEVTSIHTPDLGPGLEWSLAYGAEGRLASVTDPDGHVESYGYEPTGELSALTDRNGHTTSIAHDHLGRVLSIVDALGRAHARAYTTPVQVNSIPPSSSWVGPTLTSGSAGGTPASTDFTAALNAGDYQIGRNLYQSMGYPANVSFYRDATFQLSYIDRWDDAKRLTRHRDRAGEAVSSTDLANAASNFVDEDVSYSNNTSAPLVSTIDSPRPPFSADEANFDHNAEFDLTDTTGYGATSSNQVTYSYDRDPGGRLTAVHRRWIPSVAPLFNGPDQTYAYYPSGRVQTYAGPDGGKTLFYDVRGLLQSMTVTLGSTTEHWTFDYDAMGRSAHVVYPDGHVRAQLYDDQGRISSRCYQYGSQSYCYTATYDGAGNPVTMTDPYGGSEGYQYDALNRLTRATRSVGGSVEHAEFYSYNAIGAVKTTFDPNSGGSVTLDDQRPRLVGGGTADAAVPNTLGGQPVTLDGGGRVTSLNGVTFSYDFRNRVSGTAYTSGGNSVSEVYGYDPFMRRVQRAHTELGTTSSEFYVFDGANLVATVDQTAKLKDAYLFAGVDHPLRLSRGGSSYFYELDLAGNVRRLRDASGADLGGYRYTAFGAAFPAD